MNKAAVALLLLGIYTRSAQADTGDGALPRGTSDGLSKKLMQPLSKEPENECLSYHAAPQMSNLLFSRDGKKAYFISREKTDTNSSGKSFLYEIDMGSYKFKRIVSLRASESSALIGHGDPIEAISVFDFKQGCGEGVSAGIGLKWVGEQKIIKSFASAHYKVVPSDDGMQIADLDQKSIKSLDVHSFQKRSISNFPAKVVPLFLKQNPPVLFAFSPELLELQRFEEHASDPKAVLKLKKGMRLVQQNELFAVISAGEKPRSVQLRAVKGWSGDLAKNFEFQLPEPWTYEKTGALLDFVSGSLIVFGANGQDRRALRQILLISVSKSSVEKVINAGVGQYFSQIALDPRGHQLLVLSRSLADDVVQSLKIGDIEQGDWRDVALN